MLFLWYVECLIDISAAFAKLKQKIIIYIQLFQSWARKVSLDFCFGIFLQEFNVTDPKTDKQKFH